MAKNKKTIKTDIKFQFTIEWQWDLLRYITIDKYGYRALNKIQDHYFTLIEHQVLAHVLINFYKKHMKIPGETILREEIINLLNTRDYVKLVTKTEQDVIVRQITSLYAPGLKDGDHIYSMCKKFSSYIRLKTLLEKIDPKEWDQYEKYQHEFQNVIEDEDEQVEREESFLIRDISSRQVRRHEIKSIVPTPFRQINALTNAGGYEKGAIMVILDKQKKGKTLALVNIAKGYLRQGKKILYIDYENGRDSILTRFEQSLTSLDKKTILDGEKDSSVKKKLRKYGRIKGEVVVVRLPNGSTTNAIQVLLDKYYREHGIKFDVIICDYLARMGSLSGKKDDTERISNAYEDMANLALKNDIDHIWTANHVTREGEKLRMKTCYQGIDIAKCMDIVRHVHAIFGLNRSPEEEEQNFLRFEVVDQRDGPKGRAVFIVDHTTQNLKELTKAAREDYDAYFVKSIEDEEPAERQKKKQKGDNDFK